MNGVGNGVIVVKEASRGGPGLHPRLLELNPRDLRAEEAFGRLNAPLLRHPSPSEAEAGRIFEVVEGSSRRNSSRADDDDDVQIMQLDDDTR